MKLMAYPYFRLSKECTFIASYAFKPFVNYLSCFILFITTINLNHSITLLCQSISVKDLNTSKDFI